MFLLFGGIGQFGVIHAIADEQFERWSTKKGVLVVSVTHLEVIIDSKNDDASNIFNP